MRRALTATIATAGGLAALLSYKSGTPPQRLSADATGQTEAPASSASTGTTTPPPQAPATITTPAAPDTTATVAPTTITAPPTTARPTTTTVAPTSTTSRGIYSDGDYTGPDKLNRYGDVQVQAVVRNGRLVDVVPLQLPQDRARSQQISDYSAPILHDEAIRAQNAHIDSVSGATYTSIGYAQSLQAALDTARRP